MTRERDEAESRETYRPPGTLLVDTATVRAAVAQQAARLRPRLAGTNPLILTVMQGGVYYSVWLTLALDIPLELEYVHLSRYRQERSGGRIDWIRGPQAGMAGRRVLVVDDILDEGATLLAVREACLAAGAETVLTTVLVRKRRAARTAAVPDLYVALEVPDEFVVGCGLDYAGRWRNLPALYALPHVE